MNGRNIAESRFKGLHLLWNGGEPCQLFVGDLNIPVAPIVDDSTRVPPQNPVQEQHEYEKKTTANKLANMPRSSTTESKTTQATAQERFKAIKKYFSMAMLAAVLVKTVGIGVRFLALWVFRYQRDRANEVAHKGQVVLSSQLRGLECQSKCLLACAIDELYSVSDGMLSLRRAIGATSAYTGRARSCLMLRLRSAWMARSQRSRRLIEPEPAVIGSSFAALRLTRAAPRVKGSFNEINAMCRTRPAIRGYETWRSLPPSKSA